MSSSLSVDLTSRLELTWPRVLYFLQLLFLVLGCTPVYNQAQSANLLATLVTHRMSLSVRCSPASIAKVSSLTLCSSKDRLSHLEE